MQFLFLFELDLDLSATPLLLGTNTSPDSSYILQQCYPANEN